MTGKNFVIAFVIISNLIFAYEINGQNLVDQELKTLFNDSVTVHQDYTAHFRESENEIDIIVSSVFLFYKTFISSQDMPTCIFTPSCSVYAVEAFQNKGVITGWLSTFDRLSRCHGLFNPGHYHFDTNKKRFYDPVH
ncbi:MAG: membrane protein insertion efficiency factor YidD [Bacteroidales bacterium]